MKPFYNWNPDEGYQLGIDLLVNPRNNRCQVEDFLKELSEKHPQEFAKVVRLLKRVAQNGLGSNTEKYRQLKDYDQLWELKSYQVRLYFTKRESRIILLEGNLKKKDRESSDFYKRLEAQAKECK